MFEDLEAVGAGVLVDLLVAEQRAVAAAEARSLRITAALYRRSREWMSELAGPVGEGELREITAAEIGPALAVTRFSALAMVDLAVTAGARLPLSLAALTEGRISVRKLRLIAEHTDVLDDAACAAVEAQVLPGADTQTVPLLGAALAKAVIAADPAAAEARRRSAREDRRVSLQPGHDGMSHLHAVLPEPQARRWYDALTATAHAAASDDDDRGIDQLRADTLPDLLLQPPAATPAADADADADAPLGARGAPAGAPARPPCTSPCPGPRSPGCPKTPGTCRVTGRSAPPTPANWPPTPPGDVF